MAEVGDIAENNYTIDRKCSKCKNGYRDEWSGVCNNCGDY